MPACRTGRAREIPLGRLMAIYNRSNAVKSQTEITKNSPAKPSARRSIAYASCETVAIVAPGLSKRCKKWARWAGRRAMGPSEMVVAYGEAGGGSSILLD